MIRVPKVQKATVNEEGKAPFRFIDDEGNTQGPWFIQLGNALLYLHSDLEIRNRLSSYDDHGKKVWSGWHRTRAEARKVLAEYKVRCEYIGCHSGR
jgi:hypothetical protein